MIKTVVREYHWNPYIIDRLYLDEMDHHGLEYWYNDCKEIHDELKKK